VKNSKDFATFEALVTDFLEDVSAENYPSVLVCAIAGVAHVEEIKVANIHHWPVINLSKVKAELKIPKIHFINDLVAAG
jgi:glucokinase